MGASTCGPANPRFALNGHALAAARITEQRVAGLRLVTETFDVDAALLAGPINRLTVESATCVPALALPANDDRRALGLPLDRVTLERAPAS